MVERAPKITTGESEKHLLEADTIITALPLSPNPGLFEEFRDGTPRYALH